jgi:hypothetical protein
VAKFGMKKSATEYTEKQPDQQPVAILYLTFSGCYSVASVAKFALVFYPGNLSYHNISYNLHYVK